jgi:hypothetical protein
MLVERRAQCDAHLFVGKRSTTEADEGETFGQQIADPEMEDGRHDLAVCKVARRTEEHDDVGIWDSLNAESSTERVL